MNLIELVGVLVGVADIAGLLLAKAIFGNDEEDNDAKACFTGPALAAKDSANSDAQPSQATGDLSTLTSPAQGVLLPLLVTGGQRVGKTTMAKAFVTGQLPVEAKPSIGADLLFKTLMLGKHKAYVQIWEAQLLSTEGRSLESQCRQNVCGLLMVYSTKQLGAVEDIEAWHVAFRSQKREVNSDRILAVLGNCNPVEQEEGKSAQAAEAAEMLSKVEHYCKEHSLCHFLMSSEDDLSTVRAAFEHVINGSLQISLKKRREPALNIPGSPMSPSF